MARTTRGKLLRWALILGGLLWGFPATLAIAEGIPEMPSNTPWWVWLMLSIAFGGATFLTAVSTAVRQARKTAIQEWENLHASEKKARLECEERARSQSEQLAGLQTQFLRLQTKNQRYSITIHRLRTLMQQWAMLSDKPIPDLSLLMDEEEIEQQHHGDSPA